MEARCICIIVMLVTLLALVLNRYYRVKVVDPDEYDNAIRAKTIADLRMYMAATTIKNTLLMIDEFEEGYPAYLEHERRNEVRS